MNKITNKNAELKVLTNYDFQRFTDNGVLGKYEYFQSYDKRITVVYNVLTDDNWFEIHYGEYQMPDCLRYQENDIYMTLKRIMECKLDQSMKTLIDLVPIMIDNEYEECGSEIGDCIEKLDVIFRKEFPNEYGISPTTACI